MAFEEVIITGFPVELWIICEILFVNFGVREPEETDITEEADEIPTTDVDVGLMVATPKMIFRKHLKLSYVSIKT